MLAVTGINFNQKMNKKLNVNNSNSVINFQSRPTVDTVSFGLSNSSASARANEQLRVLTEFIGTKLKRHPNPELNKDVFLSEKSFSIKKIKEIEKAVKFKTDVELKKLRSYTEENQLGECIDAAYDFSLKTKYRPDPFSTLSIEYPEVEVPSVLQSNNKNFKVPHTPFAVDLRKEEGGNWISSKIFSPQMQWLLYSPMEQPKTIEHAGKKFFVEGCYQQGWEAPKLIAISIKKIDS